MTIVPRSEIWMMQSPLAASLAWFDGQPGEVQETVAFLVGGLVMDLAADRDEMVAQFRTWLSPTDDKLRELGTALHFRTLVEFMFQSWMTLEGQAVLLQRLQYVRESALESGRLPVEKVDAMIADRPRKDALWTEVGKSWAQLRSGPLGDVNLNDLAHPSVT